MHINTEWEQDIYFLPINFFFFDCSEKNGIDVKQLGLVSYRWLEFEKKVMTRRIDLPCFWNVVCQWRKSSENDETLSRFSIAQNSANKRLKENGARCL